MSARDEHQEVFHLQQARPPHAGSPGVGGKKQNKAPPGAGAYSKPIDPRKEQPNPSQPGWPGPHVD